MFDRKVLLINCGGVINMKSKDNILFNDKFNHQNSRDFLSYIPGIESIAKIDVVDLYDGFSLNIGPKEWSGIVDIIMEKYKDYYGFVVTVGTDSMAYLSSALSFVIQNLGKPIIVTGGRNSIRELRTDAKMNLINAFLLATADLAGVFLSMGDKVIVGARARKTSQINNNAFSTFNQTDFTNTDNFFTSLDFDLANISTRNKRHNVEPIFSNKFDNSVVNVCVSPCLDSNYLINLVDSGAKAIILQTFGTGCLPDSLKHALEELKKREIPVVVTIQCNEGTTSLSLYNIGLDFLELGLIEGYDMTFEAACVKCMWLLAHNTPYEDFKLHFQSDIAGEMDKSMQESILERQSFHY